MSPRIPGGRGLSPAAQLGRNLWAGFNESGALVVIVNGLVFRNETTVARADIERLVNNASDAVAHRHNLLVNEVIVAEGDVPALVAFITDHAAPRARHRLTDRLWVEILASGSLALSNDGKHWCVAAAADGIRLLGHQIHNPKNPPLEVGTATLTLADTWALVAFINEHLLATEAAAPPSNDLLRYGVEHEPSDDPEVTALGARACKPTCQLCAAQAREVMDEFDDDPMFAVGTLGAEVLEAPVQRRVRAIEDFLDHRFPGWRDR